LNESDKVELDEIINSYASGKIITLFLASNEVFYEFLILHELNPSVKAKNRGEQAAAEILERELKNGVDAAIFLFEDSDIKKANFLVRLPDNVLIMSTSTFLDGLQQLNFIASADEILQKAVNTRGEAIQKRVIIPMSGVENMVGSWPNSIQPK